MKKRRKKQAAALCFVKEGGKKKVVLVTSRETKRWILPKGWIEDDLSGAEAAVIEAYEEAGVVTRKKKIKKIGKYKYRKRLSKKREITLNVSVYSMPVERLKTSFKERHQRKRKVVEIKEAIKMVNEESLKELLLSVA